MFRSIVVGIGKICWWMSMWLAQCLVDISVAQAALVWKALLRQVWAHYCFVIYMSEMSMCRGDDKNLFEMDVILDSDNNGLDTVGISSLHTWLHKRCFDTSSCTAFECSRLVSVVLKSAWEFWQRATLNGWGIQSRMSIQHASLPHQSAISYKRQVTTSSFGMISFYKIIFVYHFTMALNPYTILIQFSMFFSDLCTWLLWAPVSTILRWIPCQLAPWCFKNATLLVS